MAYASVDDVKVSLGRPLTTDESEQAEALLDRVETRIKARIPTLETRLTAEDALLDLLIEVEADVVANKITNPSGFLQEQDGDYMYTRDRSEKRRGGLALSDAEWARLGVGSGAFTIAPSLGREAGVAPSALEEGPVWVNVYGGGA